MIFRQLFDRESCTYTYLLCSQGEAVLIDPVVELVGRDLALIEALDCQLRYCLETHVHADHVTGASQLREQTGCQTGISQVADVDCADLPLKDGDKVVFGDHALEVVAVPGHTDGCLAFLADGMVFTGDALLIRGCGRTDFQSGDAGTLYDSIMGRLFTLPDSTLVYPGHDYVGHTVSTIGEEKRFNPRLTQSRSRFIEIMDQLNLPSPKLMDLAVPANLACGKAQ